MNAHASPARPLSVGRYAPSPTGSLHLGNLRTALAAYLSARARDGRFLVRIEDLDRNRSRPDLIVEQLADLEALGIEWDSEPLRQSGRGDIYAGHFERLKRTGLVYPCFCSRKDVQAALSAPHAPAGRGYPGTCANLPAAVAQERIARGDRHSWRLRVQQAPKSFFDGFAGEFRYDLEAEGGDFVLLRSDGFFAYQFACALDDALSGVTEVLRGADLLDSGLRQAYVLACLRLAPPRYCHIPLMMDEGSGRLSKRRGSADLRAFADAGFDALAVRSYLAHTLGLCEVGEWPAMTELVERWDLARVPREEVLFSQQTLAAFGESQSP